MLEFFLLRNPPLWVLSHLNLCVYFFWYRFLPYNFVLIFTFRTGTRDCNWSGRAFFINKSVRQWDGAEIPAAMGPVNPHLDAEATLWSKTLSQLPPITCRANSQLKNASESRLRKRKPRIRIDVSKRAQFSAFHVSLLLSKRCRLSIIVICHVLELILHYFRSFSDAPCCVVAIGSILWNT